MPPGDHEPAAAKIPSVGGGRVPVCSRNSPEVRRRLRLCTARAPTSAKLASQATDSVQGIAFCLKAYRPITRTITR